MDRLPKHPAPGKADGKAAGGRGAPGCPWASRAGAWPCSGPAEAALALQVLRCHGAGGLEAPLRLRGWGPPTCHQHSSEFSLSGNGPGPGEGTTGRILSLRRVPGLFTAALAPPMRQPESRPHRMAEAP